MDSLAFLERTGRGKLQPVYVLHGDEDFLKRQVMMTLRTRVFGEGGDEFGLATYPGDKTPFATVGDELETAPFLSPRRLVIVDNADPFVTLHRTALEKYVGQPSATGILVLDVKTWPATTRLAKLLDGPGTITCKAPAPYKMPEWCAKWAGSHHGKELTPEAARLLVDLIGPTMGQLDQELAKLALYAGAGSRIEATDVDQLVGRSRTENIFKILDAIAGGRPGEALSMMDHLFEQGEEPLRILGAFSMQLRRSAQVARLVQQGRSLAAAMEQASIPPFARQGCEQQLRHLGRRRADLLYDWLLEVDLGLKGSSQLTPRLLLERLLARLAPPAGGAPASPSPTYRRSPASN